MHVAHPHSSRASLPALLCLAVVQGVGAGAALASSEVRGDAVTYFSPNGVQERCVMLARMPGATYRPQSEAQERRLCAIDFHQPTHALCPKLFSTSPGTLVYDLSAGPDARRPAEFEREVCSTGHVVTTEAVGGAISYKMSVNTRETSATFANASLVYYHFARYFDAAVHVPPAVLRSIDKQVHLERVARRGESVSATRPPLKMLHAGWAAAVRAEQVAYWVRELIDLTLLDYFFSQQDRIGNIDYLPHWVWVEDGQVRHQPATGSKPPAEIAARSPQLIKRTELADNDAGVRMSHANYTQRTGMLERVRHYHPNTYRQLMRLDADFAASGPLHVHVRSTFGLSAVEFDRIAANVKSAAAILRASCRAGRLRFDAYPEAYLRDGKAAEQKVDCNHP
jgi:hypothetical protein